MAGKKASGENTKKAAGNARKAEAAAAKAAIEDQKRAVAEDEEWSKGAKSSAKKFVNIFTQGLLHASYLLTRRGVEKPRQQRKPNSRVRRLKRKRC